MFYLLQVIWKLTMLAFAPDKELTVFILTSVIDLAVTVFLEKDCLLSVGF